MNLIVPKIKLSMSDYIAGCFCCWVFAGCFVVNPIKCHFIIYPLLAYSLICHFQKISERNKTSRGYKKMMQITGKKSYARVREELKVM